MKRPSQSYSSAFGFGESFSGQERTGQRFRARLGAGSDQLQCCHGPSFAARVIEADPIREQIESDRRPGVRLSRVRWPDQRVADGHQVAQRQHHRQMAEHRQRIDDGEVGHFHAEGVVIRQLASLHSRPVRRAVRREHHGMDRLVAQPPDRKGHAPNLRGGEQSEECAGGDDL
jgi:hypothetical protein